MRDLKASVGSLWKPHNAFRLIIICVECMQISAKMSTYKQANSQSHMSISFLLEVNEPLSEADEVNVFVMVLESNLG